MSASDDSLNGAATLEQGRVQFGRWPSSQSMNLSMGRDSQIIMGNPIVQISQSFKEAQKNCDSLVLSAKEHPKIKSFVTELDRMEANLKKSAQDAQQKLEKFKADPDILGMKRVSSENSFMHNWKVQTPLESSRAPLTQPIPEFSLLDTLNKSLENARLAAESARTAAITAASRNSTAIMRAPAPSSLLAEGDRSSLSSSTGAISLEKMIAAPLAVLHAAEMSYRETHVQVYEMLAPSLQGPRQAKFTTSSCAAPLVDMANESPGAKDREGESRQVINSLRRKSKSQGSPPQVSKIQLPVAGCSLGETESEISKKEEGMLQEFKNWLVEWEIREAKGSAAELSGEIDQLQQSGDLVPGKMSRRRHSMGDLSWLHLPWAKKREGSDLRKDGRKVAIVTTAALPWMTGTAVNPLLRAVFLAKDSSRQVTLVIPWLSKADQEVIFPNVTFNSPEEQEAYVREWARKRTGVDSPFKVQFYPGHYAAEKGSILPVGDLTSHIPDSEADVAVLEEPEHLNWYHHGRCWTSKFNHVVGVVHTNYLDYARREDGGEVKEKLLRAINSWVCQAHCHKVVKLSGAVQPLPKEHTEFVHGVSPTFLDVGVKKREPQANQKERFSKGFYFIGKVVWAKGYTELIEQLDSHKDRSGANLSMDVYGSGSDLDDVQAKSQQKGLDLLFHGPKDHLNPDIHEYKAFINPSTSDVVATTSAEALAMGKFVICCEHPSNQFFSTFKNCLIYRTPEEFSEKVKYAMENEPQPLSEDDCHRLTWEAATERFLDVASLTADERNPGLFGKAKDQMAYLTHNALSGSEIFRIQAGAGAGTRDNPESLTSYVPTQRGGGFMDNKERAAQAFAKTKAG